jgi:hypothetical protein
LSNALAVVLGAIISGVVGVLVIVVQQALVRSHHRYEAQVKRLSEFAAAAWSLTLVISDNARSPIGQKVIDGDFERLRSATDAFNAAMAQIQLLEDGDVYLTAHASIGRWWRFSARRELDNSIARSGRPSVQHYRQRWTSSSAPLERRFVQHPGHKARTPFESATPRSDSRHRFAAHRPARTDARVPPRHVGVTGP